MTEKTYYAIGDVHGLADRLRSLHDLIRGDHARIGGAAVVVHVGDFIDRGPQSREAVEIVRQLESETRSDTAFRSLALRGNHEQMLLDAMEANSPVAEQKWLGNGGVDAIRSYRKANGGAQPGEDWRKAISQEHCQWFRELPTLLVDPARRLAFVHAGIDPRTYPDCEDDIRIWTRSPRFFDPDRWPDRPELEGLCVVHGHTPTADFEPFVHPRRINVDTGAVYGGPLTCAVISPGEPVRFLKA